MVMAYYPKYYVTRCLSLWTVDGFRLFVREWEWEGTISPHGVKTKSSHKKIWEGYVHGVKAPRDKQRTTNIDKLNIKLKLEYYYIWNWIKDYIYIRIFI